MQTFVLNNIQRKKKNWPQFLVNCGHTICYSCIKKIEKETIVKCPFCQLEGHYILNENFLSLSKKRKFNCSDCLYPFNNEDSFPSFYDKVCSQCCSDTPPLKKLRVSRTNI